MYYHSNHCYHYKPPTDAYSSLWGMPWYSGLFMKTSCSFLNVGLLLASIDQHSSISLYIPVGQFLGHSNLPPASTNSNTYGIHKLHIFNKHNHS